MPDVVSGSQRAAAREPFTTGHDDASHLMESAEVDPEVVVFRQDVSKLRRLEQALEPLDDRSRVSLQVRSRLCNRRVTFRREAAHLDMGVVCGVAGVIAQGLEDRRRILDPAWFRNRPRFATLT